MEHIKGFDSFDIIEEKKWIKDAIKKPDSLRKKLGKKDDEKITKTEIRDEISKLRKKDKDKDKKGIQLGKKDSTKLKQLNLAKTLKSIKEGFSDETLDARKIVVNCLRSYTLSNVERDDQQEYLANEIINDLVNAGFMK